MKKKNKKNTQEQPPTPITSIELNKTVQGFWLMVQVCFSLHSPHWTSPADSQVTTLIPALLCLFEKVYPHKAKITLGTVYGYLQFIFSNG